MIEISKKQVTNIKMQWSPQELQKLSIIYNEQIVKGKKKVWKRIQSRINQTVRTTSRQALQYKWKNYCACPNIARNKICKNQVVIEQLFLQIPYKGYLQLTKCEQYKNITESNLKNTFYSNIRSLAKFIVKNINEQQTHKNIQKMLSDRNFLRFMDQNNLNIIQLRRSINKLKTVIKNRRKNKYQKQNFKQIIELEEGITTNLKEIKQLYSQYEKNMNKKSCLTKKDNQKQQSSYQDQQNSSYSISHSDKQVANEQQQQITSLQKSLQKNSFPQISNQNQHILRIQTIKSFTSLNFLMTDF